VELNAERRKPTIVDSTSIAEILFLSLQHRFQTVNKESAESLDDEDDDDVEDLEIM
jgi:hypothetical protein